MVNGTVTFHSTRVRCHVSGRRAFKPYRSVLNGCAAPSHTSQHTHPARVSWSVAVRRPGTAPGTRAGEVVREMFRKLILGMFLGFFLDLRDRLAAQHHPRHGCRSGMDSTGKGAQRIAMQIHCPALR